MRTLKKRVVMASQQENKGKKSNLSSILMFVIVFLITFAVAFYFFSTPNLGERLQETANEVNQSTPVEIDRETRLDSATVKADSIFEYNYTMINRLKSEVNIPNFKKFSRANITKSVMESPDLENFRENKVTVDYRYYDKKGEFITNIMVTPEIYQK